MLAAEEPRTPTAPRSGPARSRPAAATLALAVASQALAQCDPQRFWPDFEPRPLEYGVDVAMNEDHLIVVDRAGGTYTYLRDPDSGQWAFNHTVPAASGGAVALDGDRMVVGSLGVERYGGAVVYDFDGALWRETVRFESPEDPRYSPSGEHVALSGDTAAFANWGTMVRVFRTGNDGWQPLAELRAPVGQPGGPGFGNSMAMDDRFLFVGAPGENIAGFQNGAVYVYEWDAEGLPVLTQKLEPEPAPSGPRLGTSLAVQGDTLVVGARLTYLDGYRHAVGSAFVYEYDGTEWHVVQELFSQPPQSSGVFGVDVAIDGDLIVVGAPGQRATGAPGSGAAYIFRRGFDGRYQQSTELGLFGLPGASYGTSVDVSSREVVVGGPDAYVSGQDQGVADVYDLACILCAPDLDYDGALTIFDFLTFFNLFDDGDATADFDGDGELTLFDFLAFQTAFDAGCG